MNTKFHSLHPFANGPSKGNNRERKTVETVTVGGALKNSLETE